MKGLMPYIEMADDNYNKEMLKNIDFYINQLNNYNIDDSQKMRECVQEDFEKFGLSYSNMSFSFCPDDFEKFYV